MTGPLGDDLDRDPWLQVRLLLKHNLDRCVAQTGCFATETETLLTQPSW